MITLSCNNIFVISYDRLFQRIVLHNIRLSFFIIAINDDTKLQYHICHIARYIISTLIHHTECMKMKGMIKLWQQVVLIQHTEDMSKPLIQIKEDWQESNRFL
jgi:hypothetical protein